MVNTSEMLLNVRRGPKHEVLTAKGQSLEGQLYGDLKLRASNLDGIDTLLTISNVLEVPGLSDNLISVDCLAEKGVNCLFTANVAYLLDADDEEIVIGYGEPGDDGLRYLVCEPVLQSKASILASSIEVPYEGIELWHDRLAHTACSTIETMISANLVDGIKVKGKADTIECESCCEGKMTRGPFKGANDSATMIGAITHSDLVGPLPKTRGGKRYMASFIDEKCRGAKIALLEKKSGTKIAFGAYQTKFERENDCKLKALRSDQGGEYTAMKPYLEEQGIELQFSAAYCPESSGLAERFNRTILDMVRSMLTQSGLDEEFWGEAAVYATYIRERIMTKTADGNKKSPFERRTGKKPSVKTFKVFGCLAMVHMVRAQRKSKLGSRGWSGIFLGLSENGLFKVLNADTGKLHVVRNVRFDERKFPAKDASSDTAIFEIFENSTDTDTDTDPDDTDVPDLVESDSESESESQAESDSRSEASSASEAESEGDSFAPAVTFDVPARSSSRVRRAPVRYRASMIKVMSLKLKPGTEDEPTVTQALEGDDAPDWLAAIHSEVEQLKQRQTWNLIPRADVPSGSKILPCSIKLKKKRLEDGSVDKRKARVCIGGHKQQYGV